MVDLALTRGKHHDGAAKPRSHLAKNIEPVLFGQHQIEQHEVGRRHSNVRDGFGAGPHAVKLVGMLPEILEKEPGELVVVLNDQDSRSICHSPIAWQANALATSTVR